MNPISSAIVKTVNMANVAKSFTVINVQLSTAEIVATQNAINEIAAKFSSLYVKLPIEVQETINGIGAQASEFGADLVGKISSPTFEAVSNFAKKLPTVVIGIIMCLLNGRALRRHLRYRQEVRRTFIVPVLSAAIMKP